MRRLDHGGGGAFYVPKMKLDTPQVSSKRHWEDERSTIRTSLNEGICEAILPQARSTMNCRRLPLTTFVGHEWLPVLQPPGSVRLKVSCSLGEAFSPR